MFPLTPSFERHQSIVKCSHSGWGGLYPDSTSWQRAMVEQTVDFVVGRSERRRKGGSCCSHFEGTLPVVSDISLKPHFLKVSHPCDSATVSARIVTQGLRGTHKSKSRAVWRKSPHLLDLFHFLLFSPWDCWIHSQELLSLVN